jgi:hypothetical protein
MRSFITRIALFFIIGGIFYVVFCLVVLPRVFETFAGPNIRNQVIYSFEHAESRKFDLLILGNSRMFCGINPDKFDIPAFNFSHNNDSYNQGYYKLKWLESKQKPVRYLILGIDYFEFSIVSDTRNYAYDKYLGKEYLKDYKPKRYELYYQMNLMSPHIVRRLLYIEDEKHGLKENGQYIRYGEATENDEIKRNIKRKDLQVSYFERILGDCRKKGIRVFLVMMPVRGGELAQYTDAQMQEFKAFIDAHIKDDVDYIDFSKSADYSMKDFVDVTHLTQRAADRFSLQLNDTIMKLIHKGQPDTTVLSVPQTP